MIYFFKKSEKWKLKNKITYNLDMRSFKLILRLILTMKIIFKTFKYILNLISSFLIYKLGAPSTDSKNI